MKLKEYPKISILTPSLNQGQYIEENIRSVLVQNYPKLEHIVIDGGSTDDTVNILKKYSHLKWVSEPDEGQAHALNKGLKMSSGDIIGWQNSDDYYLDGTFHSVAKKFNRNENTRWVIGEPISKFEEEELFYKPPTSEVSSLSYEDLLCAKPKLVHPHTTFMKKDLIVEAGGWDKSFYMLMDLDLWLRMIKISEPKVFNEFWSVFRWHEEQKTDLRNDFRKLREFNEIFRREGTPRIRLFFNNLYRLIRYNKMFLKKSVKKALENLGIIRRDFYFKRFKGQGEFSRKIEDLI